MSEDTKQTIVALIAFALFLISLTTCSVVDTVYHSKCHYEKQSNRR